MKYYKKIFLMLFMSLFLYNCAVNQFVKYKDEDLTQYNSDNSENSNSEIFTVEQAKNEMEKRLVEHGFVYEAMNDERYSYLREMRFGPIILVKNENETLYDTEYFYVFYGVLPDDSIVASAALDAKTGELVTAGFQHENSADNEYLMTKDEAVQYVKDILSIQDIKISSIEPVYYSDRKSYSVYIDKHWRYKIELEETVSTKAGERKTFYVSSIILDNNKIPTATNGSPTISKNRLYVYNNINNTKGNIKDGDVNFIGLD